MTPVHIPFGDRIAPNGRLAQENFDAWFGASSMVDERGQPRVFFHGTRVDFDSFRTGAHGIFFAERPEQADSFANLSGRRGPGRVLPVFLRIEKPWTLIRYGDDVPYSRMVDQSTETLVTQGYDAMYRPDDGAWIVFSPNQIKSAIGNSGLFSRDSDDIADHVCGPGDRDFDQHRAQHANVGMKFTDLRDDHAVTFERMRS